MDTTIKPALQELELTTREDLSPRVVENTAIAKQHAEALTSIASSLATITNFISQGGLTTVLTAMAKTQAAMV